MLVSFPIALFTGVFLLDLIAFFNFDESFRRAAVYAEIGGLISAPLASIAGIIDYHYSVPPNSSAKNRATKHAFTNTAMFLVYVAAFVLRTYFNTPFFYIVLLESVGLVLIGIAAWLGGTLIVRNQIGIDHRYAEAGKWKEETITSDENKIPLHHLDELHLNQMKLLRINGQRIVVARTENGIVAFDDHCTHRGGSLADGVLICSTVQCPWHGSQFNVETGQVKCGPAFSSIKTYDVTEESGNYFLHLTDQ